MDYYRKDEDRHVDAMDNYRRAEIMASDRQKKLTGRNLIGKLIVFILFIAAMAILITQLYS